MLEGPCHLSGAEMCGKTEESLDLRCGRWAREVNQGKAAGSHSESEGEVKLTFALHLQNPSKRAATQSLLPPSDHCCSRGTQTKGKRYTHTHTFTHTHICTYMHTHTHMHTCTLAHIYTHAHIHTHTPEVKKSTSSKPRQTSERYLLMQIYLKTHKQKTTGK